MSQSSGSWRRYLFANTMVELEEILSSRDSNKVDEMKLYSMEMYKIIAKFKTALDKVAII